MSKYRKLYDQEYGKKVEFTVFIIHGLSPELYKVERFIKDELRFNTTILQTSFTGKIILNKFKDEIWDNATCAVAIMSPDDKLDSGNYRARQNVFFELGYCQAVFDSYCEDEDEELESEPVIIIKEKTIDFQDVSDLLGLEYLSYTNGTIESTFHSLGKALNNLYYELGGEEDA